MKIIAGRFKRRTIEAPPGTDVRPTSGRARQALFNTLAHGDWGVGLEGAAVLDAFAGTGALGLEALSRGASHVSFLENDRQALASLRRNIRTLAVEAETTLIAVDATRPGRAKAAVDLAFLDPPYGRGLAQKALTALGEGGWFKPGALVVVEVAAAEDIDDSEAFRLLEERRYGKAKLVFLAAADGRG
ncbi:MAG: 16S rRNA (guanine(966)-N(2))-methyltransferase RsmD [Proteobacteria bacterium]|nr:16S rRNA (guanine(966)-N(2))-methyltransferase RsmD [Pseudomonadota bacterium]MBI3495755.1 16S rRNA (guanine(966)-N(2))-methyltransferase RsmD [Pseudomonadota bacterium]